jgi:hypothetical protein
MDSLACRLKVCRTHQHRLVSCLLCCAEACSNHEYLKAASSFFCLLEIKAAKCSFDMLCGVPTHLIVQFRCLQTDQIALEIVCVADNIPLRVQGHTCSS